MAMPRGRRSSRALAAGEDQGHRAEHRGQRCHHDRPEAQEAGLEDRVMRVGAVGRSASRAKSIIMIAFFLTMPMSRNTAISAMTVNSVPVTRSASSAPTPADGRVERIVIGWMKLS